MKNIKILVWFLIGVAFLIFFPADVFASQTHCSEVFHEQDPQFKSESWFQDLRQKHLPILQIQAHELPETRSKSQQILDTELVDINPHWQVNPVEIYSPESAHVFRRMFKQLTSLQAQMKQQRLDVGRVKSPTIREGFQKSLTDLQTEITLLKNEIQMVRDNGFPQNESIEVALRWTALVKSMGDSDRDRLAFSQETYRRHFDAYEQYLFQSGVFHHSVEHEDQRLEPRIILSNHRILDLEKIKYRSTGAFFLYVPHIGSPLKGEDLLTVQWDQITRQFNYDRQEFQTKFVGRNFSNRQLRYHRQLQAISSFLLQHQQDPAGRLLQQYFTKVLIDQGRGFGFLKRNFNRRMFFSAMQPEILRQHLTTDIVYQSVQLALQLIKPSVFEYLK